MGTSWLENFWKWWNHQLVPIYLHFLHQLVWDFIAKLTMHYTLTTVTVCTLTTYFKLHSERVSTLNLGEKTKQSYIPSKHVKERSVYSDKNHINKYDHHHHHNCMCIQIYPHCDTHAKKIIRRYVVWHNVHSHHNNGSICRHGNESYWVVVKLPS